MALSEDQKAMLRLLAQRGEQGYQDIAALKGLSVDEVRAQARQAVAQLEDEGLPPPALPLDPPPAPTRQPEAPARPEEPASPAVPARPAATPPRHEPVKPASPPPAEPQVAPAAPTSTPRVEAAKSEPPPRARRPRSGGLSLPSSPALRGALAAAAAAVVIVIAIAVIGGGDDGGEETTTSSSAAGGGLELAEVANDRRVTKAALEPVDGSDASGFAVFGRVKNKLALQVEAQGLEPTGPDEAYTIWLADSPTRMLPLAFTPVEDSGRNAGAIAAQFEAPVEVLAYLANETFGQIVITKTESARLTAALKKATKAKEAPQYTGEPVLEGTISGPIVGAAKKQK